MRLRKERAWPAPRIYSEEELASMMAEDGSRAERLLGALDRVKEFSVAGRLTREELHAR